MQLCICSARNELCQEQRPPGQTGRENAAENPFKYHAASSFSLLLLHECEGVRANNGMQQNAQIAFQVTRHTQNLPLEMQFAVVHFIYWIIDEPCIMIATPPGLSTQCLLSPLGWMETIFDITPHDSVKKITFYQDIECIKIYDPWNFIEFAFLIFLE